MRRKLWRSWDVLKEELHEKMEKADEIDDHEAQLEILTELESVSPEDSAVFL